MHRSRSAVPHVIAALVTVTGLACTPTGDSPSDATRPDGSTPPLTRDGSTPPLGLDGGTRPRTDAGPVVLGDPGCGLDAAAFCETFDTRSPGGRGGDLDETRWAFSRWGNVVRYFNRAAAFSRRPGSDFDVQRNLPTLCGELFSNVTVGEDARVCPGIGVDGVATNQFMEVFDDAESFGINSMMVRQPFDFSDGGTFVFDVDGKRNPYYEGHGWWFELWVTEDPAPVPYHSAPTVSSFPRNGVGVQFTPIGSCLAMDQGGCNEVGTVFVTENHQIVHEISGAGNFPSAGGFVARDAEMNHFEVRLSVDRMEIWATDAGDEELRLIQTFDGLDLGFDVGFVHLQHSHYNAFKDGRPVYDAGVWASPAQTYRWDNIGFDGPVLPRLRSYDIENNDRRFTNEYFPDSTLVEFGYDLNGPVTFTVEGVDLAGVSNALFNFNLAYVQSGRTLRYRINGGEWASVSVPDYGSAGVNAADLMRTMSVEIPLESLVSGRNTIEVSMPDFDDFEMIGNLDLTLVVP